MTKLSSIVVAMACGCGGAAATPATATTPTPASPTTPAVAAPAAAPITRLPPIDPAAIRVEVLPTEAFLERTEGGLLLNCDLAIANSSPVPVVLTEVEASALDRSGALLFRKLVTGNGVSPAIDTVVGREIAPGQRRLVLNPAHTFPRDLEIARVAFRLTFEYRAGEQEIVATAEVAPREHAGRARLVLPLRDRVIAWSGHDYLSHHRRWDYLDPRIVELGFDSNAGRYSYDFLPVDPSGAMRDGPAERNESWFGFGKPVVAPADGVVVGAVGDQPDDRNFDLAKVKADLLVVYGNRVLIEHAPGEVSMLAHLKQGSLKVKLGDRVRAGQELAAIGASGSALMPHLHYQLQRTATGHAEGVPSTFHDFVRVRGAQQRAVASGTVEAGEIVAPRAARAK